MHKNANVSLILLSIVLIVIAGCSGQTGTTGVVGPYKVSGNQLIEANFIKDAPTTLDTDPYQPNEKIDVFVELRNKHTEEVPAGYVKVRLTGDAAIPNFFSGAREIVAPALSSYDIVSGQPSPEEVDLGPLVYIGDLPTKLSKTITGQYCYQFPVRVKAFLYYTDKPELIGTNLPSGSNPPSSVQVTQIQQQTVDINDGVAELNFRVTVKNVGVGNIVPNLGECFKYRGKRENEFITVAAYGAYPITCQGEGLIRLSRDTRDKVLNCQVTGINPSNLGPQASELSLTLTGFAYEDEIPPVSIWLEP
ncbi:MAG: hypothetical protein V1906_03115 [Candidatus Woesearchaeota archaeon]